jgi:DNA-binding NtrC family response regulator
MQISTARRILLANPFSKPAHDVENAIARVLAESADERLRELAGARAEEATLAWLHARALSGASLAQLLAEPSGAARARKSLPRAHASYARVAHASARCRAHLLTMKGTSRAMASVREVTWAACFGRSLLHGLALTRVIRDHDVLISGETGSGKEGIALAIAAACMTTDGGERAPYAEINAAAVPETLVEGELFGHVKGAFTGAAQGRQGLVRSADGGCLFLDEVGDLPLSAQVKLLRVIETDRVQPLGSDRVERVDVRFVAATHHDLSVRVREGRFRGDLYQRLAGVTIHLPALRERPEDVLAIGESFVRETLSGLAMEREEARLLAWLEGPEAAHHSWPGNVRELQNVLRNLMLGLPSGTRGAATSAQDLTDERVPERIAQGQASLAEVENWYVSRALARASGNMTLAARMLGLDRTTVARKARAASGA